MISKYFLTIAPPFRDSVRQVMEDLSLFFPENLARITPIKDTPVLYLSSDSAVANAFRGNRALESVLEEHGGEAITKDGVFGSDSEPVNLRELSLAS
jgi:hypothetical protein